MYIYIKVYVYIYIHISLLLLSRFSHVRLCATPETAAHQAAPSLGFSRQEHWSGLPFPSPMHESESEVAQVVYLKVTQSCLTPSDPMDFSLPGSSIHGIFQARVLEWGAIAFSVLYSRILFISLHLLIPNSQFISPTSSSPLAAASLSVFFVSLFHRLVFCVIF